MKITKQNILRYYVRLNSDVNGNPRYKIQANDLADASGMKEYQSPLKASYENMVKRVRKVGGGKLNSRYHPYAIKVTSYNIWETHLSLLKALKS